MDGTVHRNSLVATTNGRIWAEGCEISNNICGQITADIAQNGAIVNNRLGLFNAINQDIVDNNNSNIIQPYDADSWTYNTDDWALDELPDIDTTHGAHTGFDAINPEHPISTANLPAWPVVHGCQVQACGDETIQVQLQIRTNH